MTLADELYDLTQTALASCSEQQRIIYQLVHGIDTTGTTTPSSLEAVARMLNLSRSAARWHLAMAELAIYKLIARTLIAQRQADEQHDMPGTNTADFYSYGMSIRQRDKQTYTNIRLGEGSDDVIRASRLGNADARATRYQQIHERYTRDKNA